MNNFYTTKKVTEQITMIRSVCGELLYLVEGEDKSILIDAGAGLTSLKTLVDTLTDKPLTVLLTHGHIDHAMGAPEFAHVYLNTKDVSLYKSQCSVEERKGYIAGNLGTAAEKFADADYIEAQMDKKFHPLTEGMTFDLGGIHIDAYELDGHTPGSMIFLLRELRILILGDACNNATFLFDPNASSVEAYKKRLEETKEKHKGKYDRVFISHHEMEASPDIISEMIDVCDEIMDGTADDLPFEFMGMQACIAKQCNERFQRADGKFANLIYNKEHIWKTV